MQASFLTDVFLPIVTILGMLGLGISLTIADFKQLFIHPQAIVIGVLNQLLIVPLTGYLTNAFLAPPRPELPETLPLDDNDPKTKIAELRQWLAEQQQTQQAILDTKLAEIEKLLSS